MIILYITSAVLLALFLFWIFAIGTAKRKGDIMAPFKGRCIAHRGFFDNRAIPENSIPAFRRAIERGYGIELDVQCTRDSELCVFHDESLWRMCSFDGELSQLNYSELSGLSLLSTNEKIPLFSDVLTLIDGRVPLVVEIKSAGDYRKSCALALEALKDYKGEFCIQSFHPLAVRYFKKHAPKIPRGILSTNHIKENKETNIIGRFLLTNLLFNFLCRPDFISYNKKYKNLISYRLCRWLYRPCNAAWTIRNEKQLEGARDTFDIFIFDSFTPDK